MIAGESSFEKVRKKMVAARIEFMSQLARFSKNQLQLSPAEEEWTPLQVAYHLYIADGMVLEEMRRVQNEDNPLISNVRKEAPRRTNAEEAPASLDTVLAGMAARREEIFEFLAGLPADAWKRPFRHVEWGQCKFYQLVNVLPAHDQQHAQQLAAFKAELES